MRSKIWLTNFLPTHNANRIRIHNPARPATFDNKSYTVKTTLIARDCSTDTVPTCEQWDGTLCPNDECYTQPFEVGDKLYLQYHFNPFIYKGALYYLVNCATGVATQSTSLPEGVFTVQNGATPDRKRHTNIVIDTSLLGDEWECFYLRIDLYDCVSPPDECDMIGQHCSEPWCRVQCDQKTLLLEGSYTKYDCFGRFYGTFNNGNQSIFRAQVRIPAELIKDTYTFEEKLVGKTRNQKNLKTQFTLMSRKLPPYVAEELAATFGGMVTYIDGEAYTGALKLEKAFDEGTMWIIKTTVLQECDNSFLCGT